MKLTAFQIMACCLLYCSNQVVAAEKPYNVLFIISDDLTATALSCYGNQVCQTPHIDSIAARGTRFTHAYCQATYCGPSRASFMSGYYPHASKAFGYVSPRVIYWRPSYLGTAFQKSWLLFRSRQ